jgi:hypothetical protein
MEATFMAFLRVIVTRYDPSKLEALSQYSADTLRPAVSKAPGLQYRVSTVRDPETGLGLVVSVWDTQEQAEAGSHAVVPNAEEKLKEFGYVSEAKYVFPVSVEIRPEAASV